MTSSPWQVCIYCGGNALTEDLRCASCGAERDRTKEAKHFLARVPPLAIIAAPIHLSGSMQRVVEFDNFLKDRAPLMKPAPAMIACSLATLADLGNLVMQSNTVAGRVLYGFGISLTGYMNLWNNTILNFSVLPLPDGFYYFFHQARRHA